MLGRQDHGRVAGEPAPGELRRHPADRAIDEAEGVTQHRPGHPAAVMAHVAAQLVDAADRRGRQLLGRRDGLEVHPEDRRDAHVRGAGVVSAVDLVQDGLDLDRVVELGVAVVRGPVPARACGQARVGRGAVDLGREQVVDARARMARKQLIGGMLVRPGGAQPRIVCDLEHRVHAQVLARIHRRARGRVEGQLGRVDHPRLDRRHVAREGEDAAGEARIEVRDAQAGVDRVQVAVDVLGEVHLGAEAGRLPRRARAARGQQPAVVRVVVVDPGRPRVSAGHLGDHAREGVRRHRRDRVSVFGARSREPRKRAARMVAHPPAQIRLVQPIHRYQQDVLCLRRSLRGDSARTGRGHRGRGGERPQPQRDEARAP